MVGWVIDVDAAGDDLQAVLVVCRVGFGRSCVVWGSWRLDLGGGEWLDLVVCMCRVSCGGLILLVVSGWVIVYIPNTNGLAHNYKHTHTHTRTHTHTHTHDRESAARWLHKTHTTDTKNQCPNPICPHQPQTIEPIS